MGARLEIYGGKIYGLDWEVEGDGAHLKELMW